MKNLEEWARYSSFLDKLRSASLSVLSATFCRRLIQLFPILDCLARIAASMAWKQATAITIFTFSV